MNTPSNAPDEATIVATLAFDPRSFRRLDGWRQTYFPERGYRLPAHLTLFHKLPPDAAPRVAAALGRRPGPLSLHFAALRPLERGTAVDVEAERLHRLRGRIAAAFEGELSRQDARPDWRPHVTVQNKTDPREAEADRAAIAAEFTPWYGQGTAVRLWRYLGGPWRFEGALPL
ncbi:2'-5' RNA ligase superfamily protein [Hasllibacter halocynthiae]|uniref:2'-5' RNA ligase superfamily protein n=1 Tax=Hasllibacter halocynthiae TaxID=595589 RepID=A0A2T0X8D2_9RHOB|nr:2'-5' RNA ligase family protein [Hasllibacter halocynthiae]PRY95196.1 2'-5' RNA ligase superfamily protein [Hasllibacter halocynthiae]